MADEPTLGMVMELLLDLQHGQRQMRDELRGEIAVLRDEMREGFQRLEARMDRLEARMNRLEGRQDAMEALLRQQTRRLDALTVDIANIRHDLDALRMTLRDYHGAVIGHGIHITELDDRVRRIEEHLGLSRM